MRWIGWLLAILLGAALGWMSWIDWRRFNRETILWDQVDRFERAFGKLRDD